MSEQVQSIYLNVADVSNSDTIVIKALDGTIRRNPHMLQASCNYIKREFKLLPKEIQHQLLEELNK